MEKTYIQHRFLVRRYQNMSLSKEQILDSLAVQLVNFHLLPESLVASILGGDSFHLGSEDPQMMLDEAISLFPKVILQ